MDNAEKFELLRDIVLNQHFDNALSDAECEELFRFIDKIEERWDTFEEES